LLLNLQAKYGWSDTSIDVLFKWVTSWNLWTKVASFLLKMPSNSLVAWLGSFVCSLLKDNDELLSPLLVPLEGLSIVELWKVGTWGPLLTSITKRG
jgi:hypothetical protein